MFQGLSPLSRGGKEGQLGERGDSGILHTAHLEVGEPLHHPQPPHPHSETPQPAFVRQSQRRTAASNYKGSDFWGSEGWIWDTA